MCFLLPKIQLPNNNNNKADDMKVVINKLNGNFEIDFMITEPITDQDKNMIMGFVEKSTISLGFELSSMAKSELRAFVSGFVPQGKYQVMTGIDNNYKRYTHWKQC
jgi:hypothetical protein